MSAPSPGVAGLVMAGGLATRMGGVAKGATRLKGRPLILHSLENLRRTVDVIAVSTRPVHEAAYTGFNVPLLFDDPALEGRGPLVGLLAGLHWAERRGATALITVPCDAPFLPVDFTMRLLAALEGHDAAFAVTSERDHPLCAAWRPKLVSALDPHIRDPAGRRSIKAFLNMIDTGKAFFSNEADFLNVNTFQELKSAEERLA